MNVLSVIHLPNNDGGLRGARMVTSDARFALGQRARIKSDVSGADDCLAVYCRNTQGGTLAPGDVLMLEAANNDFNVVKVALDSNPIRVFGVVPSNLIDRDGATLATVADDYYFWAIVQGSCIVKKDGSTVAVGSGLEVDETSGGTAGQCSVAGATDPAFGYALEAESAGSPILIDAYVNCPAGVRNF